MGFVSRSELGRRLNAPNSRLAKAERAGLLTPDLIVANGRVKLFDLSRIERIRQAIATQPEVLA